jgi:hypothetical protein
MWSMARCYKQGAKKIVKQFCTEGCENRTWAREAEESPLLEVIAREWLVKTQKAENGLESAVVICELWRLAVAL